MARMWSLKRMSLVDIAWHKFVIALFSLFLCVHLCQKHWTPRLSFGSISQLPAKWHLKWDCDVPFGKKGSISWSLSQEGSSGFNLSHWNISNLVMTMLGVSGKLIQGRCTLRFFTGLLFLILKSTLVTINNIEAIWRRVNFLEILEWVFT